MGEGIVDYTKLENKIIRTVQAIESKPHIRYIRYLLSKRYSPRFIKQELFRLGLSAPHEPNLTTYFLAVMDPIIKKLGIGYIYADYKNKLLRKNNNSGDFARDILNYNLHLSDDPDGQVKFCKFVKAVETENLWINEIYKFHGSVENMPIDENGLRILEVSNPRRAVEKILIHPKRYLIDKMILENVIDSRIAKYCKEQLNFPVYQNDITVYRKAFFNIRTHALEDKLKALEIEKNSLKTYLSDLDKLEDYKDMNMGDKIVTKKQVEQRISELDDNIKTLNMLFSEYAYKTAVSDQNDFEKIFMDIVQRGYKRFCQLDNYNDRDIVEPLFKVSRMMAFAHDKLNNIQDPSVKSGATDKHSQMMLMELYKKRTDEILTEQANRANKELADAGIEPMEENLIPEEIAGIEDLGVSFEIPEDKE